MVLDGNVFFTKEMCKLGQFLDAFDPTPPARQYFKCDLSPTLRKKRKLETR